MSPYLILIWYSMLTSMNKYTYYLYKVSTIKLVEWMFLKIMLEYLIMIVISIHDGLMLSYIWNYMLALYIQNYDLYTHLV